jgi:hypothetical protein
MKVRINPDFTFTRLASSKHCPFNDFVGQSTPSWSEEATPGGVPRALHLLSAVTTKENDL